MKKLYTIIALLLISTPAYPVEKLMNSTGAVINPATVESVNAVATAISSTPSVSVSSMPSVTVVSAPTTSVNVLTMPSTTVNVDSIGGIASETTLATLATQTTSADILTALMGQLIVGIKAQTGGAGVGPWNSDGISLTTNNGLNTRSLMYLNNGSSADRAPGDKTNGADVDVTRTNSDVTYHGTTSSQVAFGSKETFHVVLDAQNISATTGFMLIDLSDTTNWPHTNTGRIFVDMICFSVNPSAAFSGDVQIGFLTNTDATDGDFNEIYTVHNGQVTSSNSPPCLDYKGIGLDLSIEDTFGPVVANDTTFQTDVNLQGPDGATSYPSGNGDMVMKITQTAGNVDVGITVDYETVP